MQGQVYKIHSDFFYVNTDAGIFDCKLRDVLKKQKQAILVGDYVLLEQINENSKQAFISKLIKRQNFISRPRVANITQAIIVSSIKEPDIDFEQLNRYIALCEYHKIKPILCFNKSDLEKEHELTNKILNIYQPLGYETLITSALEKVGIKELSNVLENNTSILCGSSGVGKSSIINSLSSKTEIKTKKVSEKTKRGVHTTRHCEIINISQNIAVVDTPGFSNLKFDFLMPNQIQDLFSEIKDKGTNCKFNNCLHTTEIECNVRENLNQIDISRYESYTKFVNEALEYKNKITYSGNKTESKTKINKNKVMTKISTKKRNISRKTNKQTIEKSLNEAKNEQ